MEIKDAIGSTQDTYLEVRSWIKEKLLQSFLVHKNGTPERKESKESCNIQGFEYEGKRNISSEKLKPQAWG